MPSEISVLIESLTDVQINIKAHCTLTKLWQLMNMTGVYHIYFSSHYCLKFVHYNCNMLQKTASVLIMSYH